MGSEIGISAISDAGVKLLLSNAILLSDCVGCANPPALLGGEAAEIFPPGKNPMANRTKLFKKPANKDSEKYLLVDKALKI